MIGFYDQEILNLIKSVKDRGNSIQNQNRIYLQLAIATEMSNTLLYIDKLDISNFIGDEIIIDNNKNSIDINLRKIALGTYEYTFERCIVAGILYKEIFGTGSKHAVINLISSDRKEILIKNPNEDLANEFNSLTSTYFNQFNPEFTFNKYIRFPNTSKMYLILNALQTNDGIILKLYEPLSTIYNENSLVDVVKTLTDEFSEVIDFSDLIPSYTPFNFTNIIKPAKFDSNFTKNYNLISDYKSYTDIIGSGSDSTKNILTVYNNLNRLELKDDGIDYTNISSYINFGNMKNMLDNFLNKVTLIQLHQSKISGSLITSDMKYADYILNITGSKIINQQMINEIFSSFTNFEKFLYFENTKYITSSLYPNEYIDICFPKSGSNISNYIYSKVDVTDNSFVNWYSTMSIIADEYDTNNLNALKYMLPEYILEDDDNADYIKFVNMIGEFYDKILIYIKNYDNIKRIKEGVDTTTTKEFLFHLLKSIGFNVSDDSNLFDLDKYYYGFYISGSSQFVKLDQSENLLTKEIYNRILNSAPYLLKSRGTKKSIYSLLNCFGVPRDIIQIREFGGPGLNSGSSEHYKFTYYDFTHTIDMDGDQQIIIPWKSSSYSNRFPDAIEFRMRTSNYKNQEILNISSSNGNLKLNLNYLYNKNGYFSLNFVSSSFSKIISSSVKEFYDGEFYSILIRREYPSDTYVSPTYTLKIINYDDYINRSILDETSAFTVTSSYATASNAIYATSGNLIFGGNYPYAFVGNLDEIRLWAEPISNDTFKYHAEFPISTNGDTLLSSIDTLAFRLSFNEPINLELTQSLLNEAYKTSSYAESASVIGFLTGSKYSFNYSDFERSNTITHKYLFSDGENEKVRIEKNWIPMSDQGFTSDNKWVNFLSNYSGSWSKIPVEKSEFDGKNSDSNLLMIGLNPTRLINNDILAFFGNQNIFDDYGDFEYLYEGTYPIKHDLNNLYWKYSKNTLNYRTYFSYLQMYNQEMFEQIKNFVPVKSDLIIGNIYEQSILHRNTIKLTSKKESAKNNTKSTYIDTTEKNAVFQETINSFEQFINIKKQSPINAIYIDINDTSIDRNDNNINFNADYKEIEKNKYENIINFNVNANLNKIEIRDIYIKDNKKIFGENLEFNNFYNKTGFSNKIYGQFLEFSDNSFYSFNHDNNQDIHNIVDQLQKNRKNNKKISKFYTKNNKNYSYDGSPVIDISFSNISILEVNNLSAPKIIVNNNSEIQ